MQRTCLQKHISLSLFWPVIKKTKTNFLRINYAFTAIVNFFLILTKKEFLRPHQTAIYLNMLKKKHYKFKNKLFIYAIQNHSNKIYIHCEKYVK